MNIRRIIFWASFAIIIGLIIWGLIVAMNKSPNSRDGINSPEPVNSTDYVRGVENAPVTLIEYSDFQCPACASYVPLIERLLEEASSTVRFVYRHFPLPQHKNSDLAARASEAAGMQGKFWEMYKELFSNQSTWSESPKAIALFEQYAGKINLDIARWKVDLENSSIRAKIQNNLNEARTIGVNATPTFFVNGKAIDNPTSYENLKKIIDEAAK